MSLAPHVHEPYRASAKRNKRSAPPLSIEKTVLIFDFSTTILTATMPKEVKQKSGMLYPLS